jgi:hypothetical protein
MACLVATTSGAAVAVPAAMAEAHAGGLRTDLAHLLRRAAGGVDLVELGGLLAQGGVCLLRLGGEAFLVPGKVEHVDPGGAEPGGQLLQRGPALLQPLRGLAGLALDFLELGPQLLRGASVASNCWRRAASLACKASYWRASSA